jgi:hypothetical protein
MLLAVLPATAPRKPRCRSMLLRWRTARLRVIDQRHCRVHRSTANVICMQIAICARSPSEPEHQPPTRHWHYPHSARTLSSGFVQSGFYEVALMPALLASPYHATSQNPQDSQISFSVTHGWSAFGGADHGWQDIGLEGGAWTVPQAVSGSAGSQGSATHVSALRIGANRSWRSQEYSADGGAACAW